MKANSFFSLIIGVTLAIGSSRSLGQTAADGLLQSNDFSADAQKADFVGYQGDTPYGAATDPVDIENNEMRVNTPGILVTSKAFDLTHGPIDMKFKLGEWTGKGVGDPVSFDLVTFSPDERGKGGDTVVGRFWSIKPTGDWQNGIYKDVKKSYGGGGKLGFGPVKVGDTIEVIIGNIKNNDPAGIRGLTVLVNGHAAFLYSNSGAHGLSLQIGFSRMKRRIDRRL